MAPPPKLVLDAGPLIALFSEKDRAHGISVQGFRVLQEAKTRLVIPMPVMFETYKWLLFRAGAAKARRALKRMLSVSQIVPINGRDLQAIQTLLVKWPTWEGTLEDASVAIIALRMSVSVWTMDYRHLSAFRKVSFWSP